MDFSGTTSDAEPSVSFKEDANTVTINGDLMIGPPPGMDGLDELAAELGVKPGGSNTLTLQGKSGDWYDWIAILAAHLKEMRRSK